MWLKRIKLEKSSSMQRSTNGKKINPILNENLSCIENEVCREDLKKNHNLYINVPVLF